MIYSERVDADEEIFLKILEKSKVILVAHLQNSNPLPNSTQFEILVCEAMKEAAIGTEFADTIRQTGVSSFPDIIANRYFGVEVKMTIKDHWRSVGNSVLEGLREKAVERIYIMFGKLGGTPDVKYRLYQDCLPSVSVTHSPRYQIDMNLDSGHSIFDKMNTSYDDLRSSGNTIEQIKSYYRSKLKDGESLWWIDEEGEAPSPVIKQFRTLDQTDKERFKVDCMILFPELFRNRANYDRTAAYLITEFGAVSASLRDEFSAGGRQEITASGETKGVSQILSQLNEYAPKIIKRINEIEIGHLRFYWETEEIEEDRVEQWKKLIDNAATTTANPDLPSLIFEAGIN